MGIKILKHEKSYSGYFLKHKALVEVSDVVDENDLVFSTSIEAGYHPKEYGLYGFKVNKFFIKDQARFIISWETDRRKI
ncbi:hypothetical protein NSQ93_22230 [Bacillus sp. FSL W8-0445]|uniref:hypothetical protein n=1 Tax=Bacillus sp. FSL W8-0445 TaxID=2954621 RepID=UPI0030FD4BF1